MFRLPEFLLVALFLSCCRAVTDQERDRSLLGGEGYEALTEATTILRPDALLFPLWLDYHFRFVQQVVVYMDNPNERPVFEKLCGNRPVTLFSGSNEAPEMTPESRLIKRQLINMKHAIAHLREQGYTWLLHIDTDELLYGPGADFMAWSQDREAGVVNFVNHEAIPVAFNTSNPFADCTYFWINGVDRNKNFLAYGNGKSAVRLGPGVEPRGPHNFTTPTGNTLSPPGDQVMILHYPHPSYESWQRKLAFYGRFADRWFGDKRAPKIIEFMRESRNIVQKCAKKGDWSKAKKFFEKRVLGDKERDREVKRGRARRYWPMVDLLG
ncbi:hypothetical protein F5Y18DRAFT_419643 [Xylariaceae sp. FL1019]|nr:hypothetical protein F5Y18DRAFT_419643 [Xylariaceae sp. FL1019]